MFLGEGLVRRSCSCSNRFSLLCFVGELLQHFNHKKQFSWFLSIINNLKIGLPPAVNLTVFAAFCVGEVLWKLTAKWFIFIFLYSTYYSGFFSPELCMTHMHHLKYPHLRIDHTKMFERFKPIRLEVIRLEIQNVSLWRCGSSDHLPLSDKVRSLIVNGRHGISHFQVSVLISF